MKTAFQRIEQPAGITLIKINNPVNSRDTVISRAHSFRFITYKYKLLLYISLYRFLQFVYFGLKY